MTAQARLEHHTAGFAGCFAAWLKGELCDLPLHGDIVPDGASEPTYPGGSKRRVTRAGDAVRANTATPEDLAVIDTWRAVHRAVLNTFQAILRNRTRGTGVVVAQRHKRKLTIFDKLHRQPKMELARMDDIAGCRLIFNNIEELRAFRARMHKANFNHKLRNKPDRYDYISNPRETGYRGIHDIYDYDVNSPSGRDYKGLYVEIQYRTLVQHAWATAVEVIGIITEHEPKFQRGDDRYEQLMALSSEILARAHESATSCFPTMTDDEVVHEFTKLDEEVRLLDLLRSRNPQSSDDVSGNVIMMLTGNEILTSYQYNSAPEALRALFKYEEEHPGADVVLVRAGSPEDVRTAYRNYFTDTADFVRLLEEGCENLSGRGIYYFEDDDGSETVDNEEDG